MILALTNNKGGVAKTTTAVNLTTALVERGYCALLIDLDNQGAASASLGVACSDRYPSAADVLLHDVPLREVIRSTACPGLDLVLGKPALANAVLGDRQGRE